MKTVWLLAALLLKPLQSMARGFFAFFQFTEADAYVLLSAYGLNAFEIDRLQKSRPEQPEPTSKPRFEPAKSASKGKGNYSILISHSAGPIPIGIHPDFISGNWKTARSDSPEARPHDK
jgi:hypothetical protein